LVVYCLKKCVGEKVADEAVACDGEVHAVGFGKIGFAPFFHRFEASHDLELVPYGAACFFGEAIEHLPGQRTIGVHHVFFLCLLKETVVVRDENEGTIGVDNPDGIDEPFIIEPEFHGVEVG